MEIKENIAIKYIKIKQMTLSYKMCVIDKFLGLIIGSRLLIKLRVRFIFYKKYYNFVEGLTIF